MLKDRDPAMAHTVIEEFKIEEQLRELSAEYRGKEIAAERKTQIEAQIDQLVRKQIELQFQRRDRRLTLMAERLAEEQKKMKEDKEKTESLVAKRVEQVKQGKFRKPPRPDHPPPPLYGFVPATFD